MPNSIHQLDRDYLAERCSILNSYLDEIISYDIAQAELMTLDFKFEVTCDIESLPILEPAKPFDWEA